MPLLEGHKRGPLRLPSATHAGGQLVRVAQDESHSGSKNKDQRKPFFQQIAVSHGVAEELTFEVFFELRSYSQPITSRILSTYYNIPYMTQ